MNPLKSMKPQALPTILVASILVLSVQQASGAIAAIAPTGKYVQTDVLTIAAPTGALDISGYAINVAGISQQDTVANAAVIASNPAVVLAARNGLIWNAIGADDPAKDAQQLANVNYAYANLITGFAGGLWNGGGINSGVVAADAQVNGALAVILYDNTQFGYNMWSGLTLTDQTFYRQTLMRISYAGDEDGDGVVSQADYITLNGYFANNQLALGDLNFDGVLSPADYLVINGGLANTTIYGNLGNATAFAELAGPSQAPEPTSGLLLLIGTACFAGLRKRKQTN